jgi:hypothetical protein
MLGMEAALGVVALTVLAQWYLLWQLRQQVALLKRASIGFGREMVRRPSAPHKHVWDDEPVAKEHAAGVAYGVYQCLTCQEHGRFELGQQPR